MEAEGGDAGAGTGSDECAAATAPGATDVEEPEDAMPAGTEDATDAVTGK